MPRSTRQVPSIRHAFAGLVACALTLTAAPVANAVSDPPTCEMVTEDWDFSAQPIEISSANALYCIGEGGIRHDGDGNPTANTLEADYVLTGNIPLATRTIGSAWRPIGLSDPFTGTLDGDGYAISGLVVNDPDLSNAGLFSQVSAATISDLTLTGPIITAHALAGALAGTVTASVITGVTATNVAVSGDGTDGIKVGGLIGLAINSSISSVFVTGTVEADGPGIQVGGVVGFADGNNPQDASFHALDGPDDAPVAPIMVVTQATFEGNVRADASAGGIVGEGDAAPTNGAKWIEVSESTSRLGAVETVNPFDPDVWMVGHGGVIGAIYDAELHDLNSSLAIDVQATSVGGLIGYLADSRLRDAEASGDVNVSLTAALDEVTTSTGDWCNAGGLVGTAQIYNREDANSPQFETMTFSNLHASGNVSCDGGDAVGGLIGYASDLDLEDATATGDVTDGPYRHYGGIGGLLGYAYDVQASDISASGDVTSPNDAVGGLVGYAQVTDPATSAEPNSPAFMKGRYSRPVTVTRGSFEGRVEGRWLVGGIIGESWIEGGDAAVQIAESMSTGTFVGERWVGGIIGGSDRAVLRDVASSGAIMGWDSGEPPSDAGFYGGVAGSLGVGSEIQRAYTTSTVTRAADIRWIFRWHDAWSDARGILHGDR